MALLAPPGLPFLPMALPVLPLAQMQGAVEEWPFVQYNIPGPFNVAPEAESPELGGVLGD